MVAINLDPMITSEINGMEDVDLINAHVIATLAIIHGRDEVMTSSKYPGAHRYATLMTGDRRELVAVCTALAKRLQERAFEACPTCTIYAGRHLEACTGPAGPPLQDLPLQGKGRCKVVADVTEPGRLMGWVVAGGVHVDLQGRHTDGEWKIFGGDCDQFQGKGSSASIALARFARACGAASGVVEICQEYRGGGTREHVF